MPHIPDQPAPRQKTAKALSGPAAKARMGLLPVLSMTTYKPDQRLIDEALQANTEVPAGGNPNFMSRR